MNPDQIETMLRSLDRIATALERIAPNPDQNQTGHKLIHFQNEKAVNVD